MEMGELKLREVPLAKAFSVDNAVNDAKRHNPVKGSRMEPGRLSGRGIGILDSIMSTQDPAKLMSIAVHPPSDDDDADDDDSYIDPLASHNSFGLDKHLQTSPAGLDAAFLKAHQQQMAEQKMRPHASSKQLSAANGEEDAPHTASQSWRSRWETSPDLMRRPPLDDSALEADGTGSNRTLEKLWPLMAAVQRRQNNGSYPAGGRPLSPPVLLTSAQSANATGRTPKLTRAQAEFLGSPHSRPGAGPSPKGLAAKHPALFARHPSLAAQCKSGALETAESLKHVDSRRERRMDPQERVRQWLEQNEVHLLSSAAPDWEQRNELPPRTRSTPQQLHRPKLSRRPKPRALQRLFSCFA